MSKSKPDIRGTPTAPYTANGAGHSLPPRSRTAKLSEQACKQAYSGTNADAGGFLLLKTMLAVTFYLFLYLTTANPVAGFEPTVGRSDALNTHTSKGAISAPDPLPPQRSLFPIRPVLEEELSGTDEKQNPSGVSAPIQSGTLHSAVLETILNDFGHILPAGDPVLSFVRRKGLGPETSVRDIVDLTYDQRRSQFSGIALVEGSRERFAGSLEIHGSIPVPSRRIDRGEIIEEPDLTMITARLDRLPPGSAIEEGQIIGREARRTLPMGRSIRQSAIGLPTIVRRGDVINVLSTRGALTITIRAVVQSDAAAGEMIEVSNASTGKALIVVLIDKSTARLP